MKYEITVSGNASLIQHIWAGAVGDALLVHIDTQEKHATVQLSSDVHNRTIEIGSEDEDNLNECRVTIAIEGEESFRREIFMSEESRHQIRFLMLNATDTIACKKVFPNG